MEFTQEVVLVNAEPYLSKKSGETSYYAKVLGKDVFKVRLTNEGMYNEFMANLGKKHKVKFELKVFDRDIAMSVVSL